MYLKLTLVALLIFMLVYRYTPTIEGLTLNANDPMINELKQQLAVMFDGTVKYDGVLAKLNDTPNLFSLIQVRPGDKSYTINKKTIYLCLRDEHNNYYNKNMLIYVFLHEIAHVLSVSINHTDEFREIFGALLSKATDMNIYDPRIPVVLDYCNTPIE